MNKRYLTDEEQRRLLKAARGATDPRAQRDYWWMRLLIATGARIEEFSLWTADQAAQALATGWIVVPAEMRKGGKQKDAAPGETPEQAAKRIASNRRAQARGHEYPVTNSVRACLEALLKLQRAEPAPADLEGPAPLVWGRDGQRLSVRSYQDRMAHWCSVAGLTVKATPHWLRHTRGMNLLRRCSGPNKLKVVQESLGHASLSSTGYYLTMSREEYLREVQNADRMRLPRKQAVAAARAGGVR